MSLTGRFTFRRTWMGRIVLQVEEEVKGWGLTGQPRKRRFRDAIAHWRDTIDADPDGELAARARENVAAAMEFARIFRTGDAALQPA